jgi:hypothetical protein
LHLEDAAEIASKVVSASNWSACLGRLQSERQLWVFVRRPASRYLSGISASAYVGPNFSKVKSLLEQFEDDRLAIYDIGQEVSRVMREMARS